MSMTNINSLVTTMVFISGSLVKRQVTVTRVVADINITNDTY